MAGRIARLAGALLLALLLAEVAVRVTGLRPPPRSVPAEARVLMDVSEDKVAGLGFMLKPDSEASDFYPGRNPGEDRTVTYSTNSLGFRDGPIELPKPEGVYRIALLGDSITYGTGVAYEDTLSQRLQAVLAERFLGAGIEVLNCGTPATNTAQQAVMLEFRVRLFEPDLVVICSSVEDTSGYGIQLPAEHELPSEAAWVQRLGLTSGLYDDASLPPAAQRMMSLRRASALADLLAHLAFRHFHGRTTVWGCKTAWREGSPGVLSVQGALARAAETARREGFRLHVAMFPFLAGLDGDYPFAHEVERMRELCTEQGLPFTDLLPALSGHRTSELQSHAHDRHPNGRANALAAAWLADALAPAISADLAR
jgi:lysophospholipase L1-like esterase